MKAATGIGIAVAAVGILLSAMMEGTSPAAFMNIPAIIIIMAGTGGVTLASVGMESMARVPKLYARVLNAEPPDLRGRVTELVGFAEKARRDGLLALDDQLADVEDDFTRKGLQLVVDGTDPDLVADILDGEISAMASRHKAGAAPFKQAGGFAPTMGIIGTVMGLVHVLQNLSAPETLGPSISGAFIATLIGVGSANVVFLPIAARLAEMSAEEQQLRHLTLEGILSIQSGDNPRIVAEKLMAWVPPEARGEDVAGDGAAGAGGAQEREAA